MAGTASGSRLPRKAGTNKKTREAIENVAFEIGIVIAIERNRFRLNQTELGERIGGGADQNDISRVERGKPAGLSNSQINKLFKVLEMDEFELQRRFLRWWQGL
jgi:hypothetical protein